MLHMKRFHKYLNSDVREFSLIILSCVGEEMLSDSAHAGELLKPGDRCSVI